MFLRTLQPLSNGYWTSIKTILQILRCIWKWFRVQKSIMNIPKLCQQKKLRHWLLVKAPSSAKWLESKHRMITPLFIIAPLQNHILTQLQPMLVCIQCPRQWLMSWVSKVFRKWTTRQCGITVATLWLPMYRATKKYLPRILLTGILSAACSILLPLKW